MAILLNLVKKKKKSQNLPKMRKAEMAYIGLTDCGALCRLDDPAVMVMVAPSRD